MIDQSHGAYGVSGQHAMIPVWIMVSSEQHKDQDRDSATTGMLSAGMKKYFGIISIILCIQ